MTKIVLQRSGQEKPGKKKITHQNFDNSRYITLQHPYHVTSTSFFQTLFPTKTLKLFMEKHKNIKSALYKSEQLKQ